MHTGPERSFVSKADRGPAQRVVEKGIPLLDSSRKDDTYNADTVADFSGYKRGAMQM